jgi:hypothetical protein
MEMLAFAHDLHLHPHTKNFHNGFEKEKRLRQQPCPSGEERGSKRSCDRLKVQSTTASVRMRQSVVAQPARAAPLD